MLAAPRIGAAGDIRAAARGQHDTRRHTATSMLMIFAAAAAGRAARFSYGVLAKAWC